MECTYGGLYTMGVYTWWYIHGGDIYLKEQTHGRDITTRRGHTLEGTNIRRDINMMECIMGGVYLQSNVYPVETHIRTPEWIYTRRG